MKYEKNRPQQPSEKKWFENVDDGRTDDGYLYILKAHL